MPFSKQREQRLNTKATDTHSGKQYSIALLDPTGGRGKSKSNVMGTSSARIVSTRKPNF